MIKVYTEVLGFNNLMYRYMSLPNSLSLADLAYYTLASYLSEEYADFVIESLSELPGLIDGINARQGR